MAYLKPQSPLKHKDGDYFYPLTTVDQVILENGNRLNSLNFISVDTEGSLEGEINTINADTLGGHNADDFVKKDEVTVLPSCDINDEGKFLSVINGVATWVLIPDVREGHF